MASRPPAAGGARGSAPDAADVVPNNLPAPATAFVGREVLLAAVSRRLLRPDVRLLTLTGPGGTGKTRLALQVAADVLGRFPDGVFFVALGSLSDPEMVAPAIAQTLNLPESTDWPLLEALKATLRRRRVLLVLDNFEQLLPGSQGDAAARSAHPDRARSDAALTDVAALLAAAPGLRVLATSRSPLRLYGEHEFSVPPLALPDRRAGPSATHVAHFEAVRLFVDRAQAVRPDFVVGDEDAGTVTEICHHLDGLPLAIELAAARLRALPLKALLERLERRLPATAATTAGRGVLPLLTGGAHDLPARQQTLRNTIGWSYDLLAPVAQTLFRRLAVFRGATLDAIEAVCVAAVLRADAPAALPPLACDALDCVTSLVEQSLLKQEVTPDGYARYTMLETVREFAWVQLSATGEAEALHHRHAAYYATLSEEAASALHGRDQLEWLRRLTGERDNLRAALEWATSDTSDTDGGGALGLRLASALEWHWILTGQLDEGRGWLERALLVPAAAAPEHLSERAGALGAAGHLAHLRNDFAAARSFHEEALALRRAQGVPGAIGRAAALLAFVAQHQSDLDTAERLGREGVALCRAAGDAWCLAFALCVVAGAALRAGNLEQAAAGFEESRSGFQACGDRWGTAWALHGLGQVALNRGELARAAACYQERLALCRELGHKTAEAHALDVLGTVAQLDGDLARAVGLFEQSLALRRQWSAWDRPTIAYLLALLAGAALGQRRLAVARERVQKGLATLRSAPQVEDQPSRGALAALLEAGAELCVLEGAHATALRLAGSARWLREQSRVPLAAPVRTRLERALTAARRAVGPGGEHDAYAAHPSGARALDLAAALLRGEVVGQGREASAPDHESVLTPREREVAALIARGYTNRRIAQELVITEGTAANHVVHILEKLGFTSRAQVAAWAVAQGEDRGLRRPPPA